MVQPITSEKRGGSKRLAWWHLGPLGPGVMQVSCGAPTNGAEENRLIRRPSCRHRRSAHVWVEKLEQGPEKSGCFCDLLRWSVGRHGHLRFRYTHFRHGWSVRQSAVLLIAFSGKSIECRSGVHYFWPKPDQVLRLDWLCRLHRDEEPRVWVADHGHQKTPLMVAG